MFVCGLTIPDSRPPIRERHQETASLLGGAPPQVQQMTSDNLSAERDELIKKAKQRCLAAKMCSLVTCPLHWVAFYNPIMCGVLYSSKADCFDCLHDEQDRTYCTQTICVPPCNYQPAPPPASRYRLNQLYSDPFVCCAFYRPCNGETIYNYLLPLQQDRFEELTNALEKKS